MTPRSPAISRCSISPERAAPSDCPGPCAEKGNGKLIMMMGLGVVGAQYTNDSDAKLDQTTPIAKLIEEASAIVVAKDSPYKTIEELMAAWKADPKSLAVGGGSRRAGRITCCRCNSLRPWV